jgi:hypothetical protein
MDVFERDEFASYRDYPNLLIRPDPKQPRMYEHYEPALARAQWHDDWLWRLLKTRSRKREFDEASRDHRYEPIRTQVAGVAVQLASNYVIFAPEGAGTYVTADPPVVATTTENGSAETWCDTPLARSLRAVVLSGNHASRRSLRTTNAQRAHPHIRLRTDPSALRVDLESLARLHRVRARDS